MNHPQTTLYYREGASDKVYQVGIEQRGSGHTVWFAYGRRGSTLTAGVKNHEPLPLASATVLYQKTVREKMSKGYTEGSDGTPFAGAGHVEKTVVTNPSAANPARILPQLLNPIDEAAVKSLIADPGWMMQEKMDGRRLLLRAEAGVITGINKLGIEVAVADTITHRARAIPRLLHLAIPRTFLIDGEAIGDTFHAFDLLELDGCDLRGHGACARWVALSTLLSAMPPQFPSFIELVHSSWLTVAKRNALKRIKAAGGEGVVFKEIEAPCTPGRPNSGGSQLKFKFHETASFIVTGANRKRSVGLGLWDDSATPRAFTEVGNVTIPPNAAIPEPASIIECRYLYAFRGGSIYQPVWLGPRDDIPADECTLSQLKFKESAK